VATILVALRLEFSAFFPEDQVASISDHLLGFPGESEKEWQRSLDLVERIGFGHLHIFAYSTWPGTRASALPNPVPREIIRARSQALHTLGSRLKRQVLERFVGRTFPVLVEQRQEGSRGEVLWTGYTRPLHFTRDGFLVVVIFWGGISTVAALPFILGAHLSFVDALFEAVSAFTTTGSTVTSGLEQLPKSVDWALGR
jgi:hypothetical protein